MDHLIGGLFAKLQDKGWMIATAESCTGGMISAHITDVSGSSAYFDRGFVTYTNQAKIQMLGVRVETLDKHGAVSEETAAEMAIGAVKHSNANISMAVTGIAGPGGGTPDKPVGLVYIACAIDEHVKVQKCMFEGDRQKVREQTCATALKMALDAIG